MVLILRKTSLQRILHITYVCSSLQVRYIQIPLYFYFGRRRKVKLETEKEKVQPFGRKIRFSKISTKKFQTFFFPSFFLHKIFKPFLGFKM